MKPAPNIQKTILRSFAAYALNETNAVLPRLMPAPVAAAYLGISRGVV